MKPGCPIHHPDLHPTAYKPQDPNDIRLILPVRGLMPMGCAKGVPGYGIIHPNLINAAVMQCYGLSSKNGHFDAMSLAPNFDLLLTQQKASNIARIIAEWTGQEEDLGERGDIVVQKPWAPSKENMKEHRDCIDPLRTSPAQTITMSQVAEVMAQGDENTWLIPIMGSILQDQGTNIRAMYHHILQCREGGTLEPKLNETTVRGIVDRVINENWLQLVSEKELEELAKCALNPGPQKLKSLLDSRSSVEGDILLWNFAGLIIQSGEWRTFHSYEEAWSLLASFWGMQTPLVIPTCTTWPALSDADSPVRQGMHLRYHLYLDHARHAGWIVPSGPHEGSTDPTTPAQPRRPQVSLETMVSMTDQTWKPDLHQGVDYLWTIMDESERAIFHINEHGSSNAAKGHATPDYTCADLTSTRGTGAEGRIWGCDKPTRRDWRCFSLVQSTCST